MLSVVILSVAFYLLFDECIMLRVIMLSVIMLSVIMLSVIMLSVIMLSVVAPFLISIVVTKWLIYSGHQALFW
jgi:hypothetical protein